MSFVEATADVSSLSLTSKAMLAMATDDVLMRTWLLSHHPSHEAMHMVARKQRGDLMLAMLQDGVSATELSGILFVTMMMGEDIVLSPLQLAVRYNLIDVCAFLWEKEEVRTSHDARSSLDWACSLGHNEIVRLLLTQPTTLTANTSCGLGGEGSWKPLQRATECARVETTQLLLSFGASVTPNGPFGTALCCACLGSGDDAQRAQIIHMLLAAPHGMSVLDQCDMYGDTPLHNAVGRGNKPLCVQALLDAGSKAVNRRGQDGTPYQLADGKPEVQAILVAHGSWGTPRCQR